MNLPGRAAPEPVDYLETLLQLGQILNSSLELKDVLDTAMEQVIKFLGAERGFILLVDIDSGRVWGEAVHDIDKAAMERTLSGQNSTAGAEISRTLVEYVLDTRQPVVTYNAMEDPRFASRQSVQLSNLRSVLCIPLLSQTKLLGIMYLDNRLSSGIFTDKHLTMLTAFGNQAAIAIENARLYDTLRRSLEDRIKLTDELRLQETNTLALEEAARLKSDFIGIVAHELCNPLTTIRGYVQTLLNDTAGTISEEIQTEFLEAIEADSDRLLDMINELLDITRLEAGKSLSLSYTQVEIRPLLEKFNRRYRFYKHYTDRHSLQITVDDDVPSTLACDENKINQVIANLLSNAIKYSPKGGIIGIHVSVDGATNIALAVSDPGIGLTEEQLAMLFKQYERIDRDDIKSIPGTGIGLYLARHLVELHHGSVSCESERGKGSCFTVRLPILAPDIAQS